MYLQRISYLIISIAMSIAVMTAGCSGVKAESAAETGITANTTAKTSAPDSQSANISLSQSGYIPSPQSQKDEVEAPLKEELVAPPVEARAAPSKEELASTPKSEQVAPSQTAQRQGPGIQQTTPTNQPREEQAPPTQVVQEQRPVVVQERAQTVQPATVSRGEVPTSIQIPAIGVNTSIAPLGLDAEGAMAAPEGPFEVGWYYPGARPGERGNVLLDGHVDWTNRETGVPFGAVFWRLRELRHGNEIYISAGGRTYTYVVEKTVTLAWNDPSGVNYLQATDTPTATIITCGGVFDRAAHNYSHRIIAVARLAG